MNEDLAYLMSKYGDFTDRTKISEDSARTLTDFFPIEMIDFWREAGLGVWQNGRFQFCDPLFMADIVEMIFAEDPDFDPKQTFLFGYGHSGRIFLWNASWRETLEIDLTRLTARSLLQKRTAKTAFDTIGSSFLYLDQDFYDLIDPATGKFVLARELKKHGGLKSGEVLGYFPALALGGPPSLDNLKKVRALEHFGLLAQLGPVELYRIGKGGSNKVRTLGAG